MKMRSLAMLAVSGMVAASFAYIAPAFADDTSPAGQSMEQAPAMPANDAMKNVGGGDASSGDSATQADSSTGSAPDQGNADQGATSSSDQSNTASSDQNAGSGSTPDQGSPDTATGDDDY